MIKKLGSALTVLFLTASAWAIGPAVVFECPYELHSTRTGEKISHGQVNVLLDTITSVEINNPISDLKKFDAKVEYEEIRTGPDVWYDSLTLRSATPNRFTTYFHTGEDGRLTFGDGKVFGSMKIERYQSYYYQKKNGAIVTKIFSDDLNPNTSNNPILCIGGNLRDAFAELKKTYFKNGRIEGNDSSIQWDHIQQRCLRESEETNEHGGRVCLEWADPIVTHVEIQTCAQ